MQLSGLHLLLTYRCTLECQHCFVWGSPWQRGTMTLPDVRRIVQQAQETGTIKRIAFEGGEPFLYYATLLQGAREAARAGFEVTIVTNGYWATSLEDAAAGLEPFVGAIGSLSISADLLHGDESSIHQAQHAGQAAQKLGMGVSVLRCIGPNEGEGGESGVMYRGRAAECLADQVPQQPWATFAACPYEDLRSPARMHVDALGNLHLCQGLLVGNLFQQPLREICARYDPDAHPIVGPLLAGGPAELARRYGVLARERCADACHLCYESRRALRERFPEWLGPDQVYGVPAN
jgi:hypothetical protein